MEGISIPYDVCDKAFGLRVSLSMHKRRIHNKLLVHTTNRTTGYFQFENIHPQIIWFCQYIFHHHDIGRGVQCRCSLLQKVYIWPHFVYKVFQPSPPGLDTFEYLVDTRGYLNIWQTLANSCFVFGNYFWPQPVYGVSQPCPPGVNICFVFGAFSMNTFLNIWQEFS